MGEATGLASARPPAARAALLLLAAVALTQTSCAAPRPRARQAVRTACIVEDVHIDGFDDSVSVRTAQRTTGVRVEPGAPSLPVAEIARALLGCAGLQVAGSAQEPCDVVLTVTARGSALAREYAPQAAQPGTAVVEVRAAAPQAASDGRVFTVPSGLTWSGTVSLSAPGVAKLQEGFGAGLSAPAEMALRLTYSPLSGSPLWLEYDKPSGRALCELPGSFAQSAVRALARAYGVPFLVAVVQTQAAPLDGFADRAMAGFEVQEQDEDLLVRSVATSPNERVRRLAARALGHVSGRRAQQALVQALRDTVASVRVAAAHSLGRRGRADVVQPLADVLQDADWEVRQAAAQALVQTQDRRAAAPLLVALRDAEWRVRLVAAGNVAGLAGRRAVPPLIAALADPRLGVRYHAVLGLEQLEDARAIGPLIAALDDEDASFRSRAMAALRHLTQQELDEPQDWRAWWSEQRQHR